MTGSLKLTPRKETGSDLKNTTPSVSPAKISNDPAQAGGGPGYSDSGKSISKVDSTINPELPAPSVTKINRKLGTTNLLRNLEDGQAAPDTPENRFLTAIAIAEGQKARANLQQLITANKLVSPDNQSKDAGDPSRVSPKIVEENKNKAHDELVKYSTAAPDRADQHAPFSQGALVMVSAGLTFGVGRNLGQLAAEPTVNAMLGQGTPAVSKEIAVAAAAYAYSTVGGTFGNMVNQNAALPLLKGALSYQLEKVPIEIIAPPKLINAMNEVDKTQAWSKKLVETIIKEQNQAADIADFGAVAVGVAAFGAGQAARAGALSQSKESLDVRDNGEFLAYGVIASSAGGLAVGIAMGVAMGRVKVKIPKLGEDGKLVAGQTTEVNLFYAHTVDSKDGENRRLTVHRSNPKTAEELRKSFFLRLTVLAKETAIINPTLLLGKLLAKAAKPKLVLPIKVLFPAVAIGLIIRGFFEKQKVLGSAEAGNKKIIEQRALFDSGTLPPAGYMPVPQTEDKPDSNEVSKSIATKQPVESEVFTPEELASGGGKMGGG
jgi:hypothetical protein